jgi:hypothetical protein
MAVVTTFENGRALHTFFEIGMQPNGFVNGTGVPAVEVKITGPTTHDALVRSHLFFPHHDTSVTQTAANAADVQWQPIHTLSAWMQESQPVIQGCTVIGWTQDLSISVEIQGKSSFAITTAWILDQHPVEGIEMVLGYDDMQLLGLVLRLWNGGSAVTIA